MANTAAHLGMSRSKFWGIFAGTAVLCSPLWTTAWHPHYLDDKLRPERTIIVTGATGLLGYPTTRHLARRHCRIIMACRDMDKCKSIRREIVLATNNKAIVCRHLDLEDIDSINKFADEVSRTEPHIDVLINNAAVKETQAKELTKYGIEKHFWVNFLAPYLLTLKLMPKLEESAKVTHDSRVVNVIGSPKKWWHIDLRDINFERRRWTNKEAYSQSKLALAYFSILLEKSNKEKQNRVYVFGTSPSAKRLVPAYNLTTGFWNDAKNSIRDTFNNSAYRVCGRTVMCALEPSLANRDKSGKLYDFFMDAWKRNNGWGIAAMNEHKAKLAWNIAADMLINVKELVKPEMNSSPDKKATMALPTTKSAVGVDTNHATNAPVEVVCDNLAKSAGKQ